MLRTLEIIKLSVVQSRKRSGWQLLRRYRSEQPCIESLAMLDRDNEHYFKGSRDS